MCGGSPHDHDPDRAGTSAWAASQIPLDDKGRHTRRPAHGPSGHNVRPRKGWGMFTMALTLTFLMCGNGGKHTLPPWQPKRGMPGEDDGRKRTPDKPPPRVWFKRWFPWRLA